MKKLLSLFLAVTLMLMLSPFAFASESGITSNVLESFINVICPSLVSGYGEDNIESYYGADSNTIQICININGFHDALKDYVNSEGLLNKTFMYSTRDSLVALSGTLHVLAVTAGLSDTQIYLYLLDDKDRDSCFFSLLDGEFTFDGLAELEKDFAQDSPAPTPSPSQPPTQADGVSYEITYQNTRVFSEYGSTKAKVLIEISNNGTENLYLKSGSYDIEDADGNLIATESLASIYPTVLAPGEKGYLYETTYLDNYTGDGNVTVLPRFRIEEATIENTRYPVSDITISDDSYGDIKVMGRVENNTNETESSPKIVIVFYDENGTPLGLGLNLQLSGLEPGVKAGFEMSIDDLPDGVTSAQIADYTVYAYPLWQIQW